MLNRLCPLRQAQRGRNLLVAHASGCHFLNQAYSHCENAYKHSRFQSNVAAVHGLRVMCVGVTRARTCCCMTNFMAVRGLFIKMGPKQT